MDINQLNEKMVSDKRIGVKKMCTKDIGHKNHKFQPNTLALMETRRNTNIRYTRISRIKQDDWYKK